MNKDLTVGEPNAVLRQFCLPLFGSIIFQQLYNIADSLVAGKFIGENALASVGNSYEVTLIFICLRLWLQHRLFRRCLPALRRERLWPDEDRRFDCLHCQRRPLPRADGRGDADLQQPALSDSHA